MLKLQRLKVILLVKITSLTCQLIQGWPLILIINYYFFFYFCIFPFAGQKFLSSFRGTIQTIKFIISANWFFYLNSSWENRKLSENMAICSVWFLELWTRKAFSGMYFLMRTHCYTVSMWHSCLIETFTRTHTHLYPNTKWSRYFKWPVCTRNKIYYTKWGLYPQSLILIFYTTIN